MGVPVAASTGSAQANSIVATNSSGYVDPSLVPSVAVTGGTIDNTVIGGTTPAAASHTTLNVSGIATFANGALFEAGYGGNGAWIDMPTSGPSGIGNGGAGANAWIGYANQAGQYFNDTQTGDIVYAAQQGSSLRFGIRSTNYIASLVQLNASLLDSTVAFTCAGLITGSAGLTISSGTSAFQATTCTTLTASGLITGSNGLTVSAGTSALKVTTCTTLTASGVLTSAGQVCNTQVLTTATTLTAASQDVFINAAVTTTLPTAPTVGQKLRLVNLTASAVTITSSKNITYGAAPATSISLPAYGQVSLTYASAAAGWA